jgi:enoyl-CoA hydratase
MNDLECFTVEISNTIASVTIARPPVNAQNRRFREECTRIFSVLSDRADVRAIILTGDGASFSAGADLKDRPDASEAGAYVIHNRSVRESFNAVLECSKPVIAAINGPAIGAGLVLASCCDILIASEVAWVSMPEVEVGLAGGVRHLLRHFGQSDARLMIFTARRIAAAELLRMGVISACVPADQLVMTARGVAEDIARNSPMAVRAAKGAFVLMEELPLHGGYRYEQTLSASLSRGDDYAEAQSAFREKRKPRF